MRKAGYVPHVRPRGEEQREKMENALFKARRWVVEACHSWFNRFRKLTIRYEKLDSTHLALTHLAAAIIALRRLKQKLFMDKPLIWKKRGKWRERPRSKLPKA
jgi:hypothetical protein